VLEPNAFALDAAEKWVLAKAAGLPAELFRITSYWHIDWFVQHLPTDRKTRYTALLAQSENYGIACGLTSSFQGTDNAPTLRETDNALVGSDGREILKEGRYRNDLDRTALIDLVAGHFSDVADGRLVVDRERADKYSQKSRLFADETEAVLRRKGEDAIKGSKPHILVIGAMAGTHAALINRGFDVTAVDMSSDVVGENLGGVTVRNGVETLKVMETADLAIITGMTLPNGTLGGLIEAAKMNNTSTMIWAVTGRNLGHYYVNHGVDCVISDPAPFLTLPGPATLEIWRREF
jgi:hypothetical protein